MKTFCFIFEDSEISQINKQFRDSISSIEFIPLTMAGCHSMDGAYSHLNRVHKYINRDKMKSIPGDLDYYMKNWFNSEFHGNYHRGVLLPACSSYYFRWFFGNFLFFYNVFINFLKKSKPDEIITFVPEYEFSLIGFRHDNGIHILNALIEFFSKIYGYRVRKIKKNISASMGDEKTYSLARAEYSSHGDNSGRKKVMHQMNHTDIDVMFFGDNYDFIRLASLIKHFQDNTTGVTSIAVMNSNEKALEHIIPALGIEYLDYSHELDFNNKKDNSKIKQSEMIKIVNSQVERYEIFSSQEFGFVWEHICNFHYQALKNQLDKDFNLVEKYNPKTIITSYEPSIIQVAKLKNINSYNYIHGDPIFNHNYSNDSSGYFVYSEKLKEMFSSYIEPNKMYCVSHINLPVGKKEKIHTYRKKTKEILIITSIIDVPLIRYEFNIKKHYETFKELFCKIQKIEGDYSIGIKPHPRTDNYMMYQDLKKEYDRNNKVTIYRPDSQTEDIAKTCFAGLMVNTLNGGWQLMAANEAPIFILNTARNNILKTYFDYYDGIDAFNNIPDFFKMIRNLDSDKCLYKQYSEKAKTLYEEYNGVHESYKNSCQRIENIVVADLKNYGLGRSETCLENVLI